LDENFADFGGKNELSRFTDINLINITGMVDFLAFFEGCSKSWRVAIIQHGT